MAAPFFQHSITSLAMARGLMRGSVAATGATEIMTFFIPEPPSLPGPGPA